MSKYNSVNKFINDLIKDFDNEEISLNGGSYIEVSNDNNINKSEKSLIQKSKPGFIKLFYQFLFNQNNSTDLIEINKGKGYSEKRENIRLNLSKILADLFNGVLKTIGSYNLGGIIGNKVVSNNLPILGSNCSVILSIIVLLFLLSKVLGHSRIELSEKQAILLMILWMNKDEDRFWINYDTSYDLLNEYLLKIKYNPLPEGEFKKIILDLEYLQCIEYSDRKNIIWIKEKVVLGS